MGAYLRSRCAGLGAVGDKVAHASVPIPEPDLSGKVIHIEIKSAITGVEIISLDVPETIHIAGLKNHVHKAIGVIRPNQRFILAGAVLSDEQTLLSIGSPTELLLVQLQWKREEEIFAEGDMVQLQYDGNHVCDKLLANDLEWIPGINDMLSRTFEIKQISTEHVWLPAPLDCKDRFIAFPKDVVRKGVSLAVGDVVMLNSSKSVVEHSFRSCGYVWHHLMKGMLGKEFRVLALKGSYGGNGIVALPSPDGSQDGKWYFPMSVVTSVTAENEDVVRKVD